MVPLVRVEAVPEETTLAGVIELVRREGFTRIPVFQKRIFNIVGVVHAFDLLEAPDLSRAVCRDDAAGELFSRIDAARRNPGRAAAHARITGGGGGRIRRRCRHHLRWRTCSRKSSAISRTSTTCAKNWRESLDRERWPFPRMRRSPNSTNASACSLPESRRVCYDWRSRGRTPRSYSEAGRAAQGWRRHDHSGAQRRSRGARSGDHT